MRLAAPVRLSLGVLVATLSAGATAQPADGDESASAIALEAVYVADAVGNVRGGAKRGIRLLDNLDLIARIDLDRTFGWEGGRALLHLLSNQGGAPNDLAGTIQGIDNIEVADPRVKLYQAWIEQDFARGRAALLLGLADLNSDFYATEASDMLIAPAFGIGPELAATGPGGPSIFPSTALTARLRVRPGRSSYAQAAIVNARAGVPGDRGGIDFSFDDGALVIAEAGLTEPGKLAIGYWRYTERQDDIRDRDPSGQPAGRVAQGAYLLAERRLIGGGARGLSGFVRLGLSDGDTTPFRAGWQTGALITGLWRTRPESRLSVGVHQARVGEKHRANVRDAGRLPSKAETGFEITYSDRLLPFLTVQPDIQYIRRPSAERTAKDSLIVGLRLIFGWASE